MIYLIIILVTIIAMLGQVVYNLYQRNKRLEGQFHQYQLVLSENGLMPKELIK